MGSDCDRPGSQDQEAGFHLRQRGAIEDFEVGREPRYRYDQLGSSSKTEQPMTGAWVGTGSGGGQKREGLRQVSVYSSKEGGHLGEF